MSPTPPSGRNSQGRRPLAIPPGVGITAKILPLEGKYYGTMILISDEYGNATHIKIWCPDQHERVSSRQLEEWGLSQQPQGEDCELLSDGHWENRVSYALAVKIVEALDQQWV